MRKLDTNSTHSQTARSPRLRARRGQLTTPALPRVLAVVVVALLALSLAWAQRAIRSTPGERVLGKAPYRTSWALLVGINDYPNLQSKHQLNYAVQDVRDLQQVLVDDYGFPARNITVLTDRQATKQGITDALAKLTDRRRVESEDRVLVYFSGHGQTVPLPGGGEMGYILPHDADVDMDDVENFAPYYSSCIRMEELRVLGTAIPAKHVLFLMDACYSGLAVGARGGLKPEIPDYLRKVASLRVRQILTAGLKGEQSYEKPEWGHGAFTYKLLEGLRTGVADTSGDDIITAQELATHLRNVVPNIAPQTPHSGYFEGEGEFLFLRSVPDELVVIEEVSPFAMLRVRSTPSGAAVYVDGVQRGVTPLDVQVDTGVSGEKRVEVVLSRSGYVTRRGRVQLRMGQSAEWNVPLETKTPVPVRAEPARQERPSATTSAPTGMVLVPEGTFQMGSNDGASDEKPVHTVELDAFYMDVHEVTNAEYQAFVEANASWQKGQVSSQQSDGDYLDDWNGSGCPSGKGQHPVVWVSWHAANAYCEWAGKRLPTEAEWEYGARGGLNGKQYPWGDEEPDGSRASFGGNEGGTTPVGKYPANGYGLHDMSGNVWEWCSDWYDSGYYGQSPRKNPTGPNSSSLGGRVLRGGSWYYYPSFLRVAYRIYDSPSLTDNNVGFRCAQDGF